MTQVTLTLRIRRPWWWWPVATALVLGIEMRLPINRDRAAEWLANRLRYEAVTS